MEEFKNERQMEQEINRWIGVVSAVKQALYLSVMVKKELGQKAKLTINWSIYISTLIYGHEIWVLTKRTRSRIQVAEMSFPCRVPGLSFRNRVRCSVISEGLLLLHVERGQLRWLDFGLRCLLDGSLIRCSGDVLEETQSKTQDKLGGLCFSAGLVTPLDSTGGSGEREACVSR